MNYKNASEILPAHLLEELQKYIDGALIYVPKSSCRTGWGYQTGLREELDARNERINREFSKTHSISALAIKYRLSEAAIKKIVYAKKQF